MFAQSYKLVDKKRFEVFIDHIEAKENEAIIKTNYMAICKADLRYYLGNRSQRILDLKYPISLIHEATATVLKDKTEIYKPGDSVVIVPNIAGKCKKCVCNMPRLGENYCPNAFFASSNYDGFSKEVFSFPADHLVFLRKPTQVQHVFTELVSVAIAAIRRVNVEKSMRVAVYGDGILGYIVCATLRCMFDCNITVIGRHKEKLEEFTMADHAISFEKSKTTKNTFDISIECVGGMGAESAIDSMLESICIGGTIVLTGVSENGITINTRRILEKGLLLVGSTRSNKNDFENAIALFEYKSFDEFMKKLVLDMIPIQDIDDYYAVFEKEADNKRLGKYIMRFS